LSLAICFGLAVALTLHIYLAARVSLAAVPGVFGISGAVPPACFPPVVAAGAGGAAAGRALIAPMFLYLRAHPEMQTRLDMLDKPLARILPRSISARCCSTSATRCWPSSGRAFGDQFLAYNIPGRPVLDVGSAVFFVLGLAVCLWRGRRPVYAFLLLWFLTGIIPSLVTGPTANTTRNMAALPAVYLIVA
jgi:hypothetical protein